MSNIVSICGSLRKGSYNRMIMNLLPALAPTGMTIKEAPSLRNSPSITPTYRTRGAFLRRYIPSQMRSAPETASSSARRNTTSPSRAALNAIDWVSRLPNQSFAGKPIAIQSASPGPLGGGRVQYDLRRMMVFLDALTLNKPEIFIGGCASKLDEKTGELKDETTRSFIKQQLEAFEKFITRHGGKT